MRKLVRIFMTVVAGMMAFSCATDTTDDLGVNLGKGQKTVISASLEESRTYLGTLAGNKYPMYWSLDDKISVNGVESEETVISEANGAVASFTVNGVEKPFCIAYPAAPKGQVLFAENQIHSVNNSFGDGVSTMYGYGEESASVTLKHLTGILKIGITGSATLKYAQISTVDRAPIAGVFNLDFAKGVVTPTADAKSVINYSFEFGGDESDDIGGLSSTPTYIYVAVPAGIYDELYVTLYDDNEGVMYATVKAGDSKPLAAGKVREFTSNIAYAPTANDVTVIKTKSDLKTWAANAAAQTVVLANDIDMKDESWSPVENFSGSFYGNGYAIKGLKAPLFGTTTASVIKGVHLEDVNIESSLKVLGALACKVDNTEAEISHCSTEGEISIIYTEDMGSVAIAGIIGSTTTTQQIYGLENRVDINLTTKKFSGSVAGCIAGDGEKLTVKNCKNAGVINFISGTTNGSTWIGGVCAKKIAGLYDCENGELNKNGLPSEKGKITIGADVTMTAYTNIAGIGASGTLSYCTNYAPIEVNGDFNRDGNYRLSVAGVRAHVNSSNTTDNISYCKNYGKLTITGNIEKPNNNVSCSLGGVVAGSFKGTLSGLENHGDIYLSNTASLKSSLVLSIAGVASLYSGNTPNCSDLKNKGNITVLATKDDTTQIFIGGILGYVVELTNASCYCNISAAGYTNVGMLAGSAYSDAIAATGCKVGGSILKGDATEAVTLTGENYYNYIYGSGNSEANANGCTYWDGK